MDVSEEPPPESQYNLLDTAWVVCVDAWQTNIGSVSGQTATVKDKLGYRNKCRGHQSDFGGKVTSPFLKKYHFLLETK
jgi:hypothetical protein